MNVTNIETYANPVRLHFFHQFPQRSRIQILGIFDKDSDRIALYQFLIKRSAAGSPVFQIGASQKRKGTAMENQITGSQRCRNFAAIPATLPG
jgi:hypothetical protein